MSDSITEPPTSTAATQQTEPEVVAAISSGEGTPDLPTDIRVDGPRHGYIQIVGLLAAGIALGYGVTRWYRAR